MLRCIAVCCSVLQCIFLVGAKQCEKINPVKKKVGKMKLEFASVFGI